jgi:hypothetical protein
MNDGFDFVAAIDDWNVILVLSSSARVCVAPEFCVVVVVTIASASNHSGQFCRIILVAVDNLFSMLSVVIICIVDVLSRVCLRVFKTGRLYVVLVLADFIIHVDCSKDTAWFVCCSLIKRTGTSERRRHDHYRHCNHSHRKRMHSDPQSMWTCDNYNVC